MDNPLPFNTHESFGDKELVTGVRNSLEQLISASSAIYVTYTHTVNTENCVRAVRSLRQVDRLLAVLVSGAGAVGAEGIVPIAWTLALSKACLQTYAMRTMFDAGHALRRGIDPNESETEVIDYQTSLTQSDATSARITLTRIRDYLVGMFKLCTLESPSVEKQVEFGSTARDLGLFCEDTLVGLGRWVYTRSSQPARPSSHTDPEEALRALLEQDAQRAAQAGYRSGDLIGTISPSNSSPEDFVNSEPRLFADESGVSIALASAQTIELYVSAARELEAARSAP